MRFWPCRVATSVCSVSGSSRVETLEWPTNQVGSAASAARSRRVSRSSAIFPPQGGTTARTSGSVSSPVSSAARVGGVARDPAFPDEGVEAHREPAVGEVVDGDVEAVGVPVGHAADGAATR